MVGDGDYIFIPPETSIYTPIYALHPDGRNFSFPEPSDPSGGSGDLQLRVLISCHSPPAPTLSSYITKPRLRRFLPGR